MLAATAAAALLAAGAASAASVEVKDAVARVTVIPENRTDIKVEVIQANPRLPLEVRTFAGRTIVDGGLRPPDPRLPRPRRERLASACAAWATSAGATCRRS